MADALNRDADAIEGVLAEPRFDGRFVKTIDRTRRERKSEHLGGSR